MKLDLIMKLDKEADASTKVLIGRRGAGCTHRDLPIYFSEQRATRSVIYCSVHGSNRYRMLLHPT